ncbi:MAG TPA: SdrD B-like domain-containing protein [Pirellulales bacterium]|nr:SdrD B-like domain-containing protein [Pirellulales bacterium]
MGLLSKLAPWRKWRRDPAAATSCGNGPHEAKTDAYRICRFEQVEERCPLAADVHLGVIYEDPASGAKTIPNTFTISWSGGAPGTELKQLVISTDPNGNPMVQLGDPFFDTGPGALSVYDYSPLDIISHDGFQVTAQNPVLGSTQLILNFSGFTAGKQLVVTLDVEDQDTNGVNATVNGKEFEDSTMIGTFSAPHYEDDTLTGTFYDMYQDALNSSGLSLPPDNYLGGLIGGTIVNTVPSPVYTAGAFAANQQTPIPITLQGTVYYDPNLDNVQEPGEPGIPNVQLTLLQNNGTSYVPTGVTTTTDGSGNYKFTNVLPGDYEIVETQPPTYLPVGSSAGNVNGVTYGVSSDAHTLNKIVVLGGEDVVDNDFSQSLPNSIAGTVRVAPIGTGEPSDAPKGGVQVLLFDKTGKQVGSTTTASDGSYSFTNLGPGTYTVKEVVPTGYYAINDVVGSDGGTAVDLTTLGNIVLTSNENGVKYDFYLQQPVTLAGVVRVSPMGTHDPNSTPLGGVTIQLLDSGGNVLATTTTAADGTYSFPAGSTPLKPGVYTVHELAPNGYYATYDAVGNEGGTTVDLQTLGNVTLTSGENGTQYNFWLQQPVSVSGTVRVSPIGTHDANSTPLGGVTVQLLDNNGNVLETTTTAADGTYAFPTTGATLLKPGTYTVHELIPNGYYATYDATGNEGGTVSNLQTLANITLSTGQAGAQYDFWLQQPVSVSGYVHSDINGCWTPTQNQNDPPVAGVTIQLLNAQGGVIGTTTTDANGFYQFQSLPPGTYSVQELLPTGWFAGASHVGSAGGTSSSDELLSAITLTSGTNGVYYDFCLTPPANISGYVHSDINGCWTPTENQNDPPVAGVTIQLLDANGNVVGTTTTDNNGFYKFTGLMPGTYSVKETLPSGWFPGASHVGTVGGTSASDELLSAVPLAGGANGQYYDFCLTPPANISGYVHSDINGCWTPTENQNDPPVAGVTIQLLDANGNVVGTTTTDNNGFYKFTGLAPANYSVQETLPSGWFAGASHVGTSGGTSSSDELLSAVPLAGGADAQYYDFCLTPPANISGYVHSDINGCWTPTENQNDPPVAGVTIQLLDANGNVVGTTTTDNNGFYKFTGLMPGTYSVHEILPSGWFAGASHVGTVGGTSASDELLSAVPLAGGANGLYYDFCLTPPANISGYVHSDINGCWTPTENQNDPPVAGVTVQLLDANGNVVGTTTTDNNGFYQFTGLAPGNYSVLETLPSGWFAGASHVGSVGGTSSNDELISSVALAGGANAQYYDFCLTPPANISGYVHSDINGCWTPTENQDDPAVPGVIIQLLDANGNVVGTTMTDFNGFYQFSNLMPGSYSVVETTPAGWYAGASHVGTVGGQSVTDTNISTIPLAAGANGLYYDFCLTPPSTIAGYVFVDGPPIATPNPTTDLPSILANLPNLRSGIREPGDTPVPGVTLMLADATGTPLLDQAGNPIETTTDANGFYQFVGLPPGLYSVIKVHPSGYIDGINQVGTAGGLAISPTLIQAGAESVGASASAELLQAVGPVNGAIARIPLANGQASLNNNFSEITLVTETPSILPPPPVIPPNNPIYIPAILPQSSPAAPPVAQPPASPFLNGSWGVTGGTWHLSVVDAGLPRTSVAVLRSAAQLAAMRADVAAWLGGRMRHGLWKLHPHHNQPGQPKHVIFGKLGGKPVTGDFNGDGVTDVGMYVNGEWFIDLNGNGIWDDADLWAKLGTKDDKPVTGDWDGDGKTDIGIFGPAWPGDPRAVAAEPGLPDPYNRPTGAKKNVPPQPHEATIGHRQLKRTRDGSLRADLIDHVFHYGKRDDVPITGDWTGTGIDSIGIFNGGEWILDVDGDGKRSDPDLTLNLGQHGDKPVVGDFNGDGIDELGVYREGHWHIDLNHDGALDDQDLHLELGDAGHSPVVGDWDGDGVDQIGVHQEQAETRGDI